MPESLLEVARGAIDGFNKTFTTSVSYVPGSLQVWLNGILLRRDFDDGWNELGSNRFQMKEVPRPGDVIQAYYRPL